MAATIDSLNVSFKGQIVRKYDAATDTTTISVNQAQSRELFDTLAPVLDFFDRQGPSSSDEIVDATTAK